MSRYVAFRSGWREQLKLTRRRRRKTGRKRKSDFSLPKKSLFDIGNDIKIGSRPDRKCTPFPYSDRREFGNFSFSLPTSHRVMEISCPSSLPAILSTILYKVPLTLSQCNPLFIFILLRKHYTPQSRRHHSWGIFQPVAYESISSIRHSPPNLDR